LRRRRRDAGTSIAADPRGPSSAEVRTAAARKVFSYVTRITDGVPELLVFDSLDEAGFEVPKGAVEGEESLEDAVHRELFEEAGIRSARVVQELGTIDWRGERQAFLLVEAPRGLSAQVRSHRHRRRRRRSPRYGRSDIGLRLHGHRRYSRDLGNPVAVAISVR